MAFDLTCLATRLAKIRSPHSASVGCALAHDLHGLAVLEVGVAVLHEQAAQHALVVHLAGAELAALVVDQDADVGLAGEDLERLVVVGRREQDLDEQLATCAAPWPRRSAG